MEPSRSRCGSSPPSAPSQVGAVEADGAAEDVTLDALPRVRVTGKASEETSTSEKCPFLCGRCADDQDPVNPSEKLRMEREGSAADYYCARTWRVEISHTCPGRDS